MATYHPSALLTDHQPAPWGDAVPITYTQRDVLLYAVGIGCDDLRFVYEGHPQFAVFPTFAIRWGSAGLVLDATALPPSPGPLTIDAERCIELLAPLPLAGTVQVRSRLLAVHPRGKGGAFVEFESEVLDASDVACVRTRPSSTACRAITTRCTSIRRRRGLGVSTHRSCTDCAPTATAARCCWVRCVTVTRRVLQRSKCGSRHR